MNLQETNKANNLSKKRRKRKVKRRLKILLMSVLIVCALVLLSLSSAFNIVSIKVKGCYHYNQEQIIEASNLTIGKNGFRTIAENVGDMNNAGKLILLRSAKSEANILSKCSYVKNTKVKFVLPKSFLIEITERNPMALVTSSNGNIIIDEEGYALDTLKDGKDLKIIAINGLKFDNYKMGQALKFQDIYRFDTAIKLMKILKESDARDGKKVFPIINSIDVSDLSRTCMRVDSRINLNLGDVYSLNYEELLYRINFFKQVFSNNIKKGDKGVLDLSSGERMNFIPEN